ncbi:unnamed protein product [Rotaria magnacalcarata]|uniref:GST N-terminal domain-containing protein n=1 Tax=Rotaria magnacalcarata TaxID=392030 RepID=A0A815W736_9BILA|nr:unnamed protein product [Rotaria magnacalcarata]CAF1569293.1 unnamed protein product [Rotaria magnacalcarata]CAF1947090.1 unnamed protein product [Rotaria magnacalcarata]CAF2131379.1 unnamed protein product [Rotaria magnacalcarata]CAF2202290.1 unnamed protein product [Rotaria magnacalcarata]
MIKPLRLYQIPWSHYCDKVRWALDYKEIPYELVTFNAFGKTKGLERAPKNLRKLTPIVEDPNSKDDNSFLSDSTPILLYLDNRYPKISKSLLPLSSEQRQQVIDTCVRLDSGLGLYARRLAYAQMFKEKPSAISLLLGERFSWAYNPDDIRSRLVSPFIASFMIARFRLHRLRDDQVREKTEQILLEIGDRLRKNDYLIGDQFSAADLTFCSLVKPLRWIPYFADDRRFQIIFKYCEGMRRNHDPKYPNIDNFLEKLLENNRIQMKKRQESLFYRVKAFMHQINFLKRFFIAFMVMFMKKFYGPSTDDGEVPLFISSVSENKQTNEALNDQRRVNIQSKWSLIKFLFKYQCHLLFTMPQQNLYIESGA